MSYHIQLMMDEAFGPGLALKGSNSHLLLCFDMPLNGF